MEAVEERRKAVETATLERSLARAEAQAGSQYESHHADSRSPIERIAPATCISRSAAIRLAVARKENMSER